MKEMIGGVGGRRGKEMGKVMGVGCKEVGGVGEGRGICGKVKELVG